MSKFIAAKASVLFSGGSDSGLAAALCLEKFEKVILLTFDPGYLYFLHNSKTMAKWLQNKYGEERVAHKIIDSKKAIQTIMLAQYSSDLKKFGLNMTNLGCLSCRLSMHTVAIIHNLENEIPYLADGAVSQQATGPEQMVSVIKKNQSFYSQFGIVHFSPIYHEKRSDIALYDMGISPVKHLKRQFILFDTQATCPFGVPAEVYGKMFYGLMGNSREQDGAKMTQDKHPLMKHFIARHFEKQNLEKLVENLREIHAASLFSWENFVAL